MVGNVASVTTLLIVGGGKMGGALLGGLLRSGWAELADVAVVEPVADRRDELAESFPGLRVLDAPEAGVLGEEGERLAGAVLAVKPDVAEGACRALGCRGSEPGALHCGRRAQRAARGGARWRARSGAGDAEHPRPGRRRCHGDFGGIVRRSQDLSWAEEVLSAVGTVVRLPERLLDAVTGLSGSGPAYFFLVAEALMEAGVQMGLSRDVSRTLVVETMRGSAELLGETGQDPEALRAMVTSPAGTTAAGIRTLESRAVRSAFMEAVAAATERSRNLQR